MSAPEPTHFIVLDTETSGLNAKSHELHHQLFSGERRAHSPGYDADCILEVGFVVLDAKTLETLDEGWTAVVPPGVATLSDFDIWCERLRTNPFVFDMHTKNGLLDFIRAHVLSAGLRADRAATRAEMKEVMATVEKVERDLCARFAKLVTPGVDPADDGRPLHTHPGNSPLVMVGNSIANLDIPMLKLWTPKLFNMFSYRIQDVSVMRMFYNDIARIELPEDLNEYIKSGGGKEAVHRALDDAQHCAHALKRLVGYAQKVARHAYGSAGFT